MLKYMTCPLTKLIFSDPVIALDGNFYENVAIKTYLQKNNSSPITGNKMGSMLIEAHRMKEMVNDFLTQNPEYKNKVFLANKPFYLFVNEFKQNLMCGKYTELKDYSSVVLNTEMNKISTIFEMVCKLCPVDIIKAVIDNSIDYDTYGFDKLKPLHIACKYSTPDVVMHLVDKGVDINSGDLNGETPLGYRLMYNSDDYKVLLEKFINNGANINNVNNSGYTIGHYLLNINDLDSLKMLIDKGFDLYKANNKINNMNFLQYAFKECKNYEIISYLINFNNGNQFDTNNIFSSEQLIYQNRQLSKKEKQQLVFEYLTKLLTKPVVIEDFL